MPRIDKLEMQGFKSFARKTQIMLPSNMSAICGPNGSGKSNVLDAICFVLGRTSAKSLRADRMYEVVFNGSGMKEAAEFAKVALFFDNSDKGFPIEENPVIVSRKVNRRGVSIYKINGRTITREKMLEILRSANIHPDGHNIILQGDVTDVIEMSSQERREIIDEVAGISEFDKKRDHAQRELLKVEDRLRESAIVLNERAASIAKLAADKDAAVKYQKLTTELDKLRASLAKKRLDEAEEAMSTLNKKLEEREKEAGKFDKDLAQVDKEFAENETMLGAATERLMDRSDEIDAIREAERLRAEITRRRDKIDFSQNEIGRIDELLERLIALQARQVEPAVRAILDLKKSGVFGTVASLSKVHPQHQAAIDIAAGPHMLDIVVADDSIAAECINHLKKNRIGRATFLPLNKVKERDGSWLRKHNKKAGVVGLAIDLVEFDKRYWHAFSHIFGDTLIVDKIDTARGIGIGEARMATLDGDLVERSGAMIGGWYNRDRRGHEGADISKYQETRKRLEAEMKTAKQEIEELTIKLERTTVQVSKGGEEVTALSSEREKLDSKMNALRLKRKEFAEAKLVASEDGQRLRITRARLEADFDNLKSEFSNYQKVKPEYKDMGASELEKEVRETMIEINSLGAINMKAIEEFDTVKVGYQELKSRLDTLTAERDRVVSMITEIEGKRLNSFTTTLNAVAEQFRTVYSDLTGGRADLRLEELDSIESGLLIEASPPGRKVLNIDAMSGGEKTLTALAFLFAIQKFRPAPFYILDEIDAALDKPNTKKIAELLKKYRTNAQFIVISHNDTMIQAADCVYGVSMEEGESKLVGIRMPTQ